MGNVYESARRLCRELRRRQTKAETILWQELRNRKFLGKKFLRQHPIFFDRTEGRRFFIADFYCAEHRLVIEIDEASHEFQKEYDEYRTHVMNAKEINVLRCANDDVERSLPQVLQTLREHLQSHSAPKRPLLSVERRGRGDEWTEAIFTAARQSLNDMPGPFITLSFAREVQENS